MGYTPKAPTPVTDLDTVRMKKAERTELDQLLFDIGVYKAQEKEAKLFLSGDKKNNIPGACETVAAILSTFGIKKVEKAGYYHTVMNGTNVTVSGEKLKTALMARSIDPNEILAILEEVTTRTSYTTVVTTKVTKEETGGATGTTYKTKK